MLGRRSAMSVIAIAKQRMTCFSNLAGCNGWPFGTPSILMMMGFPTPDLGISQDFRCYCGSCTAVSGFPTLYLFYFIFSFIFCLSLSLFFLLFSCFCCCIFCQPLTEYPPWALHALVGSGALTPINRRTRHARRQGMGPTCLFHRSQRVVERRRVCVVEIG